MARNDFLCLGKKCVSEQGATLYQDLPSDSTRCPVCGSKRLQKIWAVNVNTKRVADLVDPGVQDVFERQKPIMDAAKEARARHPAVVAAHASNLGPALAKATGMPAFGGVSAGPNKAGSPTGGASPLPVGGQLPRRLKLGPGSIIDMNPRPSLS